MKKILTSILAAGLLVGGLLYLTRRKPSALPPGGEDPPMFEIEAAEGGQLIRFGDPQAPLRAFRWLQPVQPGVLVAQVATQNDRQQIALFKDAVLQASYLVPKPPGVRDGFFRLAELRAALVSEGVAVLLYAARETDDLPVVIALDLATKTIRWTHRAQGERLALANGAIYLFGPGSPPVRLPLALADGEQTTPAGSRSSARTIDLPPEVQDVSDLAPTGTGSFLLAHKGGLSAYLGSKGWNHIPVPEGDPGLFKGVRPVLGGDSRHLWWQPYPGCVIQVLADGTPKATWTPAQLPTAEPFARDATLLHLLGSDPEGRLWFDLATPGTPAVPAPPASAEAKPEEPAGAPPAGQEPEDWKPYVSQGLDRLYCWDSQKRQLRRVLWSSLAVPGGVPKPARGSGIKPVSGAFLLENGSTAWLVPLGALKSGEPSSTLKPGN